MATKAPVMADDLYERDFVLWTEQQAEHLRQAAREGSNLPLDWENLAEEIESLGRSDLREAESLIYQILVHLAKLAASPAPNPRTKWISEVGTFRFQLDRVLRDSPSLRNRIETSLEHIAAAAVRDAGAALAQHGEILDSPSVMMQLQPLAVKRILDPCFLPSTPASTES